jgi:uncharacterized membrane protein
MKSPSRRGRPRLPFPLRPSGAAWPDEIDLLLVVLGTLLAAIGFAFDLPVWVRLPIGLLATLSLPGYALGMAVFPPGRLDGVERTALSFSLSVGAIVAAAPIMNLAPEGLTERTVVASISAITIGGVAVAWWRRREVGAPSTNEREDVDQVSRLNKDDVGQRVALIVVGLAVIAVASTLSRGAGGEQPTATEFFLLRAPGTSEGILERVVVGVPSAIPLGITNHDPTGQTYRIVVRSPTERVGSRGPIVVAPGATWSGRVDFTLAKPARAVELQVLLYRETQRDPYRSLRLIVDAVAPPATERPSEP